MAGVRTSVVDQSTLRGSRPSPDEFRVRDLIPSQSDLETAGTRPARRGTLPWVFAVILGVAAAAAWFWNPFQIVRVQPPSPESTYLPLNATDNGGRMRVAWDTTLPSVRSAQSATLEVIDGNIIHRYPMEPRVLMAGSFDYLRHSEDVLLRMQLYREGRPFAQGYVRSVAGPTAEVKQVPREGTRSRVKPTKAPKPPQRRAARTRAPF